MHNWLSWTTAAKMILWIENFFFFFEATLGQGLVLSTLAVRERLASNGLWSELRLTWVDLSNGCSKYKLHRLQHLKRSKQRCQSGGILRCCLLLLGLLTTTSGGGFSMNIWETHDFEFGRRDAQTHFFSSTMFSSDDVKLQLTARDDIMRENHVYRTIYFSSTSQSSFFSSSKQNF